MADLFSLSEICRIPTHMPFGKHRGMPLDELPRDYVGWLLRQDDVDQYLRKALAGRKI
jgi:exodeoxyribonuclease X